MSLKGKQKQNQAEFDHIKIMYIFKDKIKSTQENNQCVQQKFDKIVSN